MHRIRTIRTIHTVLAAAAAAAVLATTAGSGPAAAAGDAAAGKQVLDLLCTSKGGTPYFTPYTISRCQTARDRQGVEVERLVCEGLLGGQFASVSAPGRHHRTNWACVSGPAEA